MMKSDPSFNFVKNQFRGIVAVYKSKKFIKDKTLTDSAVFRQGVKSLLLESRTKFSEGRFNEVISWVNASIKSQLPELSHQKIGFEELRFAKPDTNKVSISTEMLWIASRLSAEAQNINKFLSFKKNIEAQILKGKYIDVLSELAVLEKELGASLWSIKLRISLLQTSKGLEAQKQYTNEVRNVWTGGILSYIALFVSVRNEDRTTIGKFIDDIETKFSNPNIDPELVPHLRYHLLTELPKDEDSAIDLLLMEQMGSIYDLYELLVSMLLDNLHAKSWAIKDNSLIEILKKLGNIQDLRLNKISEIKNFQLFNSTLRQRDYSISDYLLDSDCTSKLSIYKSFRSSSDSFLDVWNHIYIGIWLGLLGKDNGSLTYEPHKLPILLGKALSEENLLNDVKYLIKLSVNYHGLSIFKGIKEFLLLLLKQSTNYDALWSPHTIGLHSESIGIEDYPLSVNSELGSKYPNSLTKNLWMGRNSSKSIDELTFALMSGLRHIECKEYEMCLSVLPQKISLEIPFPFRLIFTQMKLSALSFERRKSEVIHLINETVPESADIIDIVSFESELVDYEYKDFECENNVLSAPIALFIAWLKTEDSKLLSYLRIATKQAIKKLNLEKPSTMVARPEKYSNSQLVFFLNYICVPQVIDNIRSLNGTKAVLNERQCICRLLIALDPINADEYHQEIASIDDDLLMEEGKRVVDRTRIYVDMDAHSRWMLKELKEDYERYKDLLDINITGEQNYSEIVDDFLKSDGATKTTFQPDNEADAVLLSLIVKASNDFLTNPKYGLDYYLSKRIRHQSFIGLIRSHLEFSNLITTRVTEGEDFEYNHFWVNKFHSLSQDEKDQLNNLLSKFAEEFDDLLIHVRDNIFQLNTEDCPTGLIKIDFNIHVMSLLKHFIIETNASFEEFVYYSNIFMWAFLQPSLEKTKAYIQSNLKQTIMHSADILKAHARKLAGLDPAFEDFELQLTDKTAAVQRSLEDVMSWFTPLTGVSAERVVISVEQALNLSIKAALDMLRPFEPKLNTKIINADDLKLQQLGLTFLNDTIFILFDNIKAHSGLKNPEIELRIEVNKDEEVITVHCVNNTRQSDRVRLKQEIDKIKVLIENGKIGDRAKLEGRSGFIKLAASIDKATKGHLDFDLLRSGQFSLTITNDLAIKALPMEQVRIVNV